MNKKDIPIYIILFSWLIILPTVFYLFTSNINIPPTLPIIFISRIYSFSYIILLVVFLFLWLHSLIKLIHYKKDKKLVYRRNLTRYTIFLLIIFLSWYISLWIGQNTGIEIGDGMMSYRL